MWRRARQLEGGPGPRRPWVPAGAAHWTAGGRPGCFQVALTCTQIWWTTEVGLAFARLEEGYENAIKDYNKKQVCGPGSTVPAGRKPQPWPPPRSRPGGAPSQIGNFSFLSGNHRMLLQAFFFKKRCLLRNLETKDNF